jgi:hypothetical protein
MEADNTAPKDRPSVRGAVMRPKTAPAIDMPSLSSGHESGPDNVGAPKSARMSVKLAGKAERLTESEVSYTLFRNKVIHSISKSVVIDFLVSHPL